MTTPRRGFTLIEMIVSLAIFALVVVAIAGAYINLINLDRQTRGINDVVDNLSFSLDSMNRAIRTGTGYNCEPGGGNCPSTPGNSFTFTNSSNQVVTYLLGTGTNAGRIGECTGALCTAASATYFTDPRINVTTLAFYVSGVGAGDQYQPRVTVVIHGTLATSGDNSVAFSIQTTATERGIDI